MSDSVTRPNATLEGRYLTEREGGNVRRLGSAIGLATISLLDLLALDDITTAGAWMPEIVFLIASVPALVTLAYFTFRGSAPEERLEKERK